MPTLTINEDFIKEKHICWVAEEPGTGQIVLYEIVERTYRHPEALEWANVVNVEKVRRNSKSYHNSDADTASWRLLIDANKVVSQINNQFNIAPEEI